MSENDRSRRIAVISTSRADYSHLYWVLKALQERPGVDLRLLVTGAHLSDRFGYTIRHIREDGFTVDGTCEALLDSNTDVGMAKTIGLTILSLADQLDRLRPDLLLLIADRYEMLGPAATALALRIPMAHIEGGDVSEGAVDDAVRNALTKMSHLHFTPTALARQRVLAMGEESWRVHHTGAPSLDHLRRSKLPGRRELEQTLGRTLDRPPCVVAYHPVTLLPDPAAEVDALFQALETVRHPVVFCFPNADAGHQAIMDQARAFCARREDASLHVNLSAVDYWSLLQHAHLMLGNSSSGIMETPSLKLPCVNVGIRQQGREQAANIVDAAAEPAAIRDAIREAESDAFRARLANMENPYGDGHAGERIARVLSCVRLDPQLLMKKPLPLADVTNPATGVAFQHEQ